MLFERFLRWTAAAPAPARAEAARALVAAYSDAGLDRQRADGLDRMVAALLDDPCLSVRRALSEAAARSLDVPRCVVVALAGDDATVAVPVLAASALLSEADLVEAAAAGDDDAQMAIAGRSGVPQAVATALADAGPRDVVLTLIRNPGAIVPSNVLRRILERFGDDAEIREALLDHVHHDPALHHELVLAGTEALTRFAMACDWLSPARADNLRRESHDKGVVTIAARCRASAGPAGPRALVRHLRAHGRLTPALLLRALLSGNGDLCEAALAHLSGLEPARAAGHMRAPDSLGFASLYAKAGLPPVLLPVFRAALSTLPSHGADRSALSREAVAAVLAACLKADLPELARVTALLRRLEAEALRDDVRLRVLDEPEPVRHAAAPDFSAVRPRLPLLRAA